MLNASVGLWLNVQNLLFHLFLSLLLTLSPSVLSLYFCFKSSIKWWSFKQSTFSSSSKTWGSLKLYLVTDSFLKDVSSSVSFPMVNSSQDLFFLVHSSSDIFIWDLVYSLYLFCPSPALISNMSKYFFSIYLISFVLSTLISTP